jgi:hypothetical protein
MRYRSGFDEFLSKSECLMQGMEFGNDDYQEEI